MSVVVILLMFSAVIVMVKNVDNERESQARLVADSNEPEDGSEPPSLP